MIITILTFLLITVVHFTGAVQKKRPSKENVIDKTALLPDWKGKRQRSIRNGQGDVIIPIISSKRQRKIINYKESDFSSLTPSSSSNDLSFEKLKPNAELKLSLEGKPTRKWKPAGYFSNKERAKRTAKRYLSEGKYKNEKEALKRAWMDIRERKRIDAFNRRQRIKSNGTKGGKSIESLKPHHHSKERVIGRKVTRLLAGNNNVVRYQVARKLAEEEYAKETREYSALYRKRKQAIKKQG